MAAFSHDADTTKVFIDGVEVTLTARISGSINYDLNDVGGIGDSESLEFPPGHVQYRFTINGIIPKTDKAITRGIIPENGKIAIQGKNFPIEIYNLKGVLLERYEKAVCESAEHSLDQYRLYLRNATFRATTRSGGMSA